MARRPQFAYVIGVGPLAPGYDQFSGTDCCWMIYFPLPNKGREGGHAIVQKCGNSYGCGNGYGDPVTGMMWLP